MKEYLQLFRDQAFSGAFSLMKRILVPNILISMILGIVSILAIMPLILKGLGWTFADLFAFNERLQEIITEVKDGDNFESLIMAEFGQISKIYLAIAIILSVLFSAYQYLVFLTLNDQAVRNNNTNILNALKSAFTLKIFTMTGLFITMMLLFTGFFLLYVLILTPLMMFNSVLGALIGFILFFALLLMIIRLMIAPAAMVHGKMGIIESIAYSFKKITWKRAGILFLLGLIFIVAFVMTYSLIGSITGAIFGIGNMNMNAIVIGQIISSAIGAVLSAFLYSSLTAIYFRYSSDNVDTDENIEEHLIS